MTVDLTMEEMETIMACLEYTVIGVEGQPEFSVHEELIIKFEIIMKEGVPTLAS